MNIAGIWIRRPVMTMLVMIGILIFGIVAYRRLPVSDLPTVDFPTINVSASAAGREPGDDGVRRRDAAREAVLDDRRHRQHDVDAAASARRRSRCSSRSTANIDAAAQDVQAAIAKTLRHLPPGIIPPSYQKVESGGVGRFCILRSRRRRCRCRSSTSTARRISRSASRRCRAWRRCRCTARRSTPSACSSIRRRSRIARSASTKWRCASTTRTSTCRPACCGAPNKAYTVQANGQLAGCGGVPADGRRLPQRRAGSARRHRPRARRRPEQQGRELVQRRARHRARHSAAAGHQHRRRRDGA